MPVILDLCGGTGNWSQPYREAGYDVIIVDPQFEHAELMLPVEAVRRRDLPRDVRGVLAAPPCTHFASSGAQYWPAKDRDGRTAEAVGTVRACLRILRWTAPAWWCLENPVGRLPRVVPELGRPVAMFDPCDYGGYLEPWEQSCERATPQDAYTKKTCLWGDFLMPDPMPVEPVRTCSQGSWLQTLPGQGVTTQMLRSATPLGFARAFFGANP